MNKRGGKKNKLLLLSGKRGGGEGPFDQNIRGKNRGGGNFWRREIGKSSNYHKGKKKPL